MDKLKKALVGSILISVILAVTLTYVWATTPTTTFYISTGVYPGAPSYTVWSEGSGASRTTYAKRYDGYFPTWSGSTNGSYVLNQIIDSFSGPSTIGIISDLIVNDTILVDKNNVTIYGNNHFVTLGASSNCNLFNVTGNCTSFIGLLLRGNRANQTSVSHAIYFHDTYLGKIESCDIRYFNGDGISIHGNGLFGNHYITKNKIVDLDGHGIDLDSTCDEIITNNDIGGVLLNCITAYDGTGIISNNHLYMGGWNGTAYQIATGGNGLYLYYSRWMIVSENIIFANAISGIRMDYVTNCTFTGNYLNINDQGGAGGNFSTGYRLAFCNYTVITGGLSGNFEQAGGTFSQDYGIVIGTTGNNYNLITGVTCIGNTAKGIQNYGGATNQIHLCYNGTTWID